MSAPASSSPSVTTHGEVLRRVQAERPPGWTAGAGLAYVVLSLAGLALAPLPDLGAGTGETRQFLATASAPSYTAGGLTELVAYLALLMFVLGVTTPARTSGYRGAAVLLAPVGAVLATAAFSTAAALVGAVVLTPAAPVSVARVVLTSGSLATWLSVAGIAVAMAALATLGSRGTSLPRWAGWSAAVVAVLLAAAIPFAETAWAHLPAVLLDVWVIAVSLVTLRRAAVARREPAPTA